MSMTPVVEKIGTMHFEGNVIPHSWYEHLRMPDTEDSIKKNQKRPPYSIAIEILADIVYWYRPVELRDENTGQVIGHRKKFKAEMLQRSYGSLAEFFGYTKRQVADACYFLRDKDLITLQTQTITTKDGHKIPHVLFIGLNPEALSAINKPKPKVTSEEKGLYAVPYEDVIYSVETRDLQRRTYTENTTEISTEKKEEEIMGNPELFPDFASSQDSQALSVAAEEKSKSDKAFKESARRMFEHWKKVMKKTAATKLSPDREKLIIARLKEYSEEDVKLAIDGCAMNDWNMARGDHKGRAQSNGINLICRNSDKLEYHRDFALARQKPQRIYGSGYSKEEMSTNWLDKKGIGHGRL